MDGSTFPLSPASPIDPQVILTKAPADPGALAVALTTPTAPRLNKRATAKAATRAKVVSAAAKLFAEVGYEKATIRDIAKSAKMSTGAVFANFEDKAALYTAIQGHAPVTTEQGLELFMLMRDLLPEAEAEILERQASGVGAAFLTSLFDRASTVVQAIKDTAPEETDPA